MPLLNPTTWAAGVWANAPIMERHFDPSLALWLDEQFQCFNTVASTGDWVSTAVTSGTAAVSTTVPGALLLDSGASTAHQGIQVQRLKSPFVPAANKSIWYEVLVNVGTSLSLETFIGLAASDTTIIASGAMTTNNRIGWTSTTGDGVLLFDSDKAGTGTTKTGTTLVVGTDVRLGFRYDGAADTLQQYINGVATSAAVATANIPKLVVYPSFVCQTAGTTQPTMTVKGVRVMQLR